MSDKPILFSAPMVRALLDGRKSQTRRVLKPRSKNLPSLLDGGWADSYVLDPGNAAWLASDVPYAPGDRLWVKETSIIAPAGWTDSPVNPMGPHRQEVGYVADDRSGYMRDAAADYKLKVRSSIHMPRWASRLTLLVTNVRVERLQDISEEDAIAEGLVECHEGWASQRDGSCWGPTPVRAYAVLWNSLNGPGAWEANLWAVAVSFDVRKGNIDGQASAAEDALAGGAGVERLSAGDSAHGAGSSPAARK